MRGDKNEGGSEPEQSELKKACDEIAAKKKAELEAEEQRRIEHRRKADEVMQARSNTLKKLREIGAGMSLPTNFRPHLVCKKLGKNDKEHPEHGVQFRRSGDDCLLEALNGVAAISICLQGEGEQCPKHPVAVPARAMALVAKAEAEFAQLWFHDGKVTVFVDDALHEFFQIQQDLPFPTENLRAKPKGTKLLQAVTFDAELLHRIQKALGTDHVALRQADKHMLSVWPDGNDKSPSCGFLMTFTEPDA
jgi:hypothetical protein